MLQVLVEALDRAFDLLIVRGTVVVAGLNEISIFHRSRLLRFFKAMTLTWLIILWKVLDTFISASLKQ